MLDDEFIKHLNQEYHLKIKGYKPLSGGDINAVYLLKTTTKPVVIKINWAAKYPEMFKKEQLGLQTLKATQSIDIPTVISLGHFKQKAYLLLTYKEPKPKNQNYYNTLGEHLARLHQNTAPNFGLKYDNYIGSLPQTNQWCDTSIAFFITQRLEPQFKLAKELGYTFKNIQNFYQSLHNILPDESPSLIHGDLWSGNCIVNNQGNPCLIDPAISYASREMDIAMMHLFGGFKKQVYESYHAHFPLISGWENRLQIWQLYYILVHVNLFGGHYYASAKAIMKQYT